MIEEDSMSKFSKLIHKITKRPFCSVVVVAAGSSTRAGRDKLFYSLGGTPVLAHTLQVFENCPQVNEIILVMREDRIPEAAELCRQYGLQKVKKILCGGATRTESALSGVSETDPKADLIAIHDGARPFVTEELMQALIHDAVLYHAAAPGLPLRDTLKHVEKDTAVFTVPRAETVAIQTPQVFQADLIKAALSSAVEKKLEITDDCSAVEAMGFSVHVTPGSEENIKITLPIDFMLAETIRKTREQS